MSGWQDIATAPKDQHVLIYAATNKWRGMGGVSFGYQHSDYNGHSGVWTLDGRCGAVVTDKSKPTHWMPLPEAPEVSS